MQNFSDLFQHETRHSVTGVHVKLQGVFTHENSSEFSKLIEDVFCPAQRIFIDVRSLTVHSDLECQAFKNCIQNLPAQQVIFKGEQGFKLGQEGNKVLIVKDKPCKCDGTCKTCACDMRIRSRNETHTFHLPKELQPRLQ